MANSVINPKSRNSDRKVRSVISFNDGSTWKMISPPESDRNGNPYNCKKLEACNLHFHSRVGIMSNRGTFRQGDPWDCSLLPVMLGII